MRPWRSRAEESSWRSPAIPTSGGEARMLRPGQRAVSRREALRKRGLYAAGAALGLGSIGCGSPNLLSPRTGGLTARRRLAPVRASADRVIREVAGLRPFRASGFVVRAETLGDKLLVHNYGHGGAGITLSWGTAQLAVEEVLASGRRGPVAVLGCGVIGLSTARLLQRHGFAVTIYARDLPPDTTSNVAGGIWYPSLVVESSARTPAFVRQLDRAARFAHRSFQELVGDEYGVYWRENYFLSDERVGEDWTYARFRDLFVGARWLDPEENPFPVAHAAVEETLFIEPPVYLRALLRDVRLAGGKVVVRELRDARQVSALPEPIVVNCTGLGARDLFGDRELVPIKGQLVVLAPQPAVGYGFGTSGDLYMIPRRDGILLGGTRQEGVETLEPDPEESRRILEQHRRIFDGMDAKESRG